MDHVKRWHFTKYDLEATPTRRCGVDAAKESSYRQQAANFIQDMGQRLHVTQLCINTAIVYMHRFYMFHSFTKLHRNQISVAALFLAAKVEEQPRKLEHTVRVAHKCLHRGESDMKSDIYHQKRNELKFHEKMMLETLGFDIAIDHPHTYVVKLLQLVKATKELAQTSYFMATNSLHLTTMCLQYRPTVVACVCINIACKWSDWKIEPSSEGKEWYYYVDKSVTPELLEELTKDFILVLEKSPNRLRRRIYPGNNKDGQSSQSEFRAGDELATHIDTLPYDNSLEPTREHSPVPSTSTSTSSTAVIPKEEKSEKLLESGSSTATDVGPYAPLPSSSAKPKAEVQHSVSREKHDKVRPAEPKPSVPAPMELPLPPIARSAPVQSKHSNFIKDKTVLKSDSLLSDLVPQKSLPLKNNSTHQSSAILETTTSCEKLNHEVKKPPAALPPAAQPPPPKRSKTDCGKSLHGTSKGNDPFVLLTRFDEMPIVKKECDGKITQPAQSTKMSSKTALSRDVKQVVEARPVAHLVPPTSACDTKNVVAKVVDAHIIATRPTKPAKSKIPLVQNSHTDISPSTQGNMLNPSPVWDVVQANGSSILDVTDGRLPMHVLAQQSMIDQKTVGKTPDARVKNEKREKHKHRHSSNSLREECNFHVQNIAPEGGIKITIPMEKISLRGSQKASASQDHDNRKKLKIKLSTAKTSTDSLKLVITKDKNAGSYTTHKAEKASRKRDRSPCSKEQNSRSSKHKMDQSTQNDRIPARAEARNNVGCNASQSEAVYNQNSAAAEPYVIPQQFHTRMYYQQQPYYNFPLPATNMQYGHMQPPPPPPPALPSSNAAAPPLPRGPPPPLPPQPPSSLQ